MIRAIRGVAAATALALALTGGTAAAQKAGGIHLCFGGPLARLEAQIAVGEFVRRAQNPRLVVDPPPYRHNQIFRGPRHVLVDIDGVRD